MVQAPLNSTPTRTALPRSLWLTWFVSVMLLIAVGSTLLCFPMIAQQLWPWPLAPFNTRLMGAIYFCAAIPLMGYLLNPQLSYMRVVLPVFTCFTTYFLLVSMVYTSNFLPRKASAIWFFLYGADSLVGLYFCWRVRHQLRRLGSVLHWPRLYRLQSLILMGYGLGLLVMPSLFGQMWAWPLDSFHARLYSGVLITSALGMELLRAGASVLERLWFSGTQLILGGIIFLGTWLVDWQVSRLDWQTPWPWLWQGVFLGFAGLGGWIFVTEIRGLSRER